MQISTFRKTMPRAIVVSHERSGTHFLMNSLAAGFGYISEPFINFDQPEVNINYFRPSSIAGYFKRFEDKPLANTVKSHHPVEFFDGILERLTRRYTVFYIYRDPRDTMLSLWEFLHKLDWREGPKLDRCRHFIRAEPSGRLLRYQLHQYPNMLKRWEAHVRSWLHAAEDNPEVVPVAYEALNEDYAGTLKRLAERLGIELVSLERPSRTRNVVLPSTLNGQHRWSDHFNEADMAFFEREAGETMQRLGYR